MGTQNISWILGKLIVQKDAGVFWYCRIMVPLCCRVCGALLTGSSAKFLCLYQVEGTFKDQVAQKGISLSI